LRKRSERAEENLMKSNMEVDVEDSSKFRIQDQNLKFSLMQYAQIQKANHPTL
jgi:hypothetical protein